MMNFFGTQWRIEYRADMRLADSPLISLGVLYEAAWPAHEARWLGLAFRRDLYPLETDCINYDTWPELKEPEVFMRRLFDQCWQAGEKTELGTDVIAESYPAYSAMHFTRERASVDVSSFDPHNTFLHLTEYLSELKLTLKPTLSAPVYPFAARPGRKDEVLSPVGEEMRSRAA
ncbi:hypothetical protein [Asticcacaulis solisilvae]|uniref:hypothetical protein n=1 Tax=Asticcacaulis solisilvae TaxID=1217274 RepID=UPI003FD79FE5